MHSRYPFSEHFRFRTRVLVGINGGWSSEVTLLALVKMLAKYIHTNNKKSQSKRRTLRRRLTMMTYIYIYYFNAARNIWLFCRCSFTTPLEIHKSPTIDFRRIILGYYTLLFQLTRKLFSWPSPFIQSLHCYYSNLKLTKCYLFGITIIFGLHVCLSIGPRPNSYLYTITEPLSVIDIMRTQIKSVRPTSTRFDTLTYWKILPCPLLWLTIH